MCNHLLWSIYVQYTPEVNVFYFYLVIFSLRKQGKGREREVFTGNRHMHSLQQLESVYETVPPRQQQTNSVIVDGTVGNDTVFQVTWQTSGPPEMAVLDPSGRKYNTTDFVINLGFRTASLRVPGTAKVSVGVFLHLTILRQVLGLPISHALECVT